MGWTSYHAEFYKNGKIDRKKEVESNLNLDTYEVLKSSMAGSTYYAAVKNKQNEEVFAVITMTIIDMKDYYNFSYKMMDETYGVGLYDCPKSILDLLTPTDNEYAIQWRNKCRSRIDGKKNGLGKLPIGARVKVIAPYETNYFNKDNEFIMIKKKYSYDKMPHWEVEKINCRIRRIMLRDIQYLKCYTVL